MMEKAFIEAVVGSLYGHNLDWWILATAPLAGRLAFAAVFVLLIAWLVWIPAEKLQAGAGLDKNGKTPSVAAVRYSAIAIAAVQVLLYLFWN